MTARRYRPTRLAARAGLALVLILAGAGAAPADDRADCHNRLSSRRIDACSAVIDSPAASRADKASALGARGLAWRQRGNYPKAFADYDAALALEPRNDMVLNNRAWARFKSGHPADGLPDVERALAINPANPNSLDTRAHIHQALGAVDKALADYEQVMRRGGAHWIRLYQCGLEERGHYKGARDGILRPELASALAQCARQPTCDPLPSDEECRVSSS